MSLSGSEPHSICSTEYGCAPHSILPATNADPPLLPMYVQCREETLRRELEAVKNKMYERSVYERGLEAQLHSHEVNIPATMQSMQAACIAVATQATFVSDFVRTQTALYLHAPFAQSPLHLLDMNPMPASFIKLTYVRCLLPAEDGPPSAATRAQPWALVAGHVAQLDAAVDAPRPHCIAARAADDGRHVRRERLPACDC